MKSLITLMLLMLGTAAHGSILNLQPGTKVIEGVTAAGSGNIALKGQSIELQSVCAALRWKPILVAKINAYVGTHCYGMWIPRLWLSLSAKV